MIENFPNIIPTILMLSILSILPFLVVTATSFTKISIVLMLLRNALGVQQAPSSLVINSIALTLTIFISFPLFMEILAKLDGVNLQDAFSLRNSVDSILSGFIKHLSGKSSEIELSFFINAAKSLWPTDLHSYAHENSLIILLPAHIVSELSRAFQIGFLLFLPFVVIDLIVSNILLAMGAMMVPPMLISLPLKILLFVAADGWAKLLHSLILSYAT